MTTSMEEEPVRIQIRHSPNPNRQTNYTLICRSHSVCTTVTSRPAVVRQWIRAIRHRYSHRFHNGRLVVGLGVQWSPNENHVAATLQLCVGHRSLIFQLLHADRCPVVLRRFLTNPGVTFVGFWNSRDEDLLLNSKHRLRVQIIVDLREVASDLRRCRRRASMETLAAEILGMQGMVKDERVGLSDWNNASLSAEQVKYASLDAFLAFLVGTELRVWDWVCSST